MALTTEDTQILNGLFPFDQHEFNPRGFVYISEQAICARLDQVDPSWHWDIKSVQVRDNVAVCVGTLTVKGVTREGVGMDKIQENAGEAEKSAATDALKRAARLFGIGRYLLDNPKEVEFKKWLSAQQNSARKAADVPRPTTGNPNAMAAAIYIPKDPPLANPVNPTGTPFTKETASEFEVKAAFAGVNRAEALEKVLKVSTYGQFTGTYEDAVARLDEYLTGGKK